MSAAVTVTVAMTAVMTVTVTQAQTESSDGLVSGLSLVKGDIGPELVKNGQFSAGMLGWRTNAKNQHISKAPGGKGRSSAARLTTDTVRRAILNDSVNTVRDADVATTYRVSALIRSATGSASGQLRVREVSSGSRITHAKGFQLRDSSWRRAEMEFTTTAPHASLDLNVLAWDNRPGRGLLVDAVSMVAVTGPAVQSSAKAGVAPTTPHTSSAPVTPTPPRIDPGVPPVPPSGPCTVSARGIPTCGAYVGAAVGGNSDPAPLEESVGHTLGVRRTYWGPSGVDAAVRTAEQDIARGRLPWISFKLPFSWTAMADGQGDAWVLDLSRRLSGLNGPVWIAFNHEPENDGGQISEWRRMQEHIAPIVRKAAPNVAFTVILMGWHQFYGAPELSLANIWPRTTVDVAGFDIYNGQGAPSRGRILTAEVDLQKLYFRQLQQWSTETGVPWALAETGYTNYTAERQADWIQTTARQLVADGGIAFTYFNSPLNSLADWTLGLPSKLSDFGAALRGSTEMRS